MTKGKADRVDLSHLSFKDAVKQAWEAEPPKDEQKTKERRRKKSAPGDNDHTEGGSEG